MDNYNTENIWEREHIVRATLQYKEYKGHIAMKVTGNCKGKDMLGAIDFECFDNDNIQNLIENDCNLCLDEDERAWSITLTDSKGEQCEFDYIEECEMNDFIVKLEIISCELKEEK